MVTVAQTSRAPRWPWAVMAGWLAVAIAVGASGVTARLRPPAPQLVLLALTAALVAAYFASAGFRAWADALDLRALAAFHLTRFVGAYFLVLYARGELPYGFAVPGGWGDIVAAVGALVLASVPPPRPLTRGYRRAFLAWNVFGLLDILLVVATAARFALTDPESMRPLTRMPLDLLVTYVVPLVIASHLLVFARLRRTRHAAHGGQHAPQASHGTHAQRAGHPRRAGRRG